MQQEQKKPKLTSPFMTKYELPVVLGRRAQQIALGARPAVKLTSDDHDPLSIAKRELDVESFVFFDYQYLGRSDARHHSSFLEP